MKTDPNFPVLVVGGVRKIERAVDMTFRSALHAHAQRVDPRVGLAMAEALSSPPSTVSDTQRFYGNALDGTLAATSPLMNELENFIPGIQKWLNVTGYGNCFRMIAALHLWVEVVNSAHPRGINSDKMH